MEDLNLQVIKGFDRKLKSYVKVKGMYICNTDRGTKLVRKLDISREKIIFENTAKEILYKKGFKNIDKFCISTNGFPYYILNDSIYVMSDYIEGVECDLSKNCDIAVEQLAKMHTFSYGLSKCDIPMDIISVYKKRISEMARLKKRINSMSCLTDLDILILKNYDYYYNQCKKAIDILENSEYRKFAQNAKNRGLFCHNNYREENIVINVDGTYIINFETCCCDIQTLDLANIIRRYMKKTYCDEQKAYRFIEVYDSIKNISKEELKILFGILTFPYKFSKVCNKYFNRRRSWVQNGMTYNLEMYLVNRQKNDRLLKLIERDI